MTKWVAVVPKAVMALGGISGNVGDGEGIGLLMGMAVVVVAAVTEAVMVKES